MHVDLRPQCMQTSTTGTQTFSPCSLCLNRGRARGGGVGDARTCECVACPLFCYREAIHPLHVWYAHVAFKLPEHLVYVFAQSRLVQPYTPRSF